MKHLLSILLLIFTISPVFSQVIWLEDFSDEADGATTGLNTNTANPAADWTTACVGCSGFLFDVNGGANWFEAYNLDGIGTLTTEAIDISGTGLAVAEVDAFTGFAGAGDYIRCYYELDGGPRTLFFEIDAGFFNADLPSTVILQGSSVVLEFEVFNDGFFDLYIINEISVTAITNLFSRASADAATSGTWSIAGYGGADCACTPGTNNLINIGAGFAVTSSADLTVAGINMDGGSFTLDGAVDLNLQYGSTVSVASGASFTNTNANSRIEMLATSQYTYDTEGSLNVGFLFGNEDQEIFFTGNGSLTLGELTISENLEFTNNMTGAFNVTNNINFNTTTGGDAIFTNNGTVNITGSLLFDNDASTFDNAGTLTAGTIALGGNGDNLNTLNNTGTATFTTFDNNNANTIITNSGTINQLGSFANNEYDDDADFTNSATGIWNYAGTAAYDPNILNVLDLSALGNTFNYTASASQEVIPFTYSNLGMNGSTMNDLSADVTVNNQLSFGGSSLELNGFELTIGSSGSISGASSSGFVVISSAGTLTQENIGPAGRTGDISFPVGTADGDYTPLTVNNTGTTDNFSVSMCDVVYLDDGNCASGSVVQSEEVVNKTWEVTEAVAGGSSVILGFQWNAANEGLNFDRSFVRVSNWTGAQWDVISSGFSAGSDPYTVSSSAITSFSPFAIEDRILNPLPIEQISFEVQAEEKKVNLKWETIGESNVDYYSIERAGPDMVYEEILKHDSKGNNEGNNKYQAIDVSPIIGHNYYRIKKVSNDGSVKYFGPRHAEIEFEALEQNIDLYPVPNKGREINLRLSGMDSDLNSMVLIRDISGNIIQESIIEFNADDGFESTLEFEEQLPKGIYFLELQSSEPINMKFLVE